MAAFGARRETALGRPLAALVLLLAVSGRLAAAAEDASGPPPSSPRSGGGPGTYELLPGIGRIGAEVTLLGGTSMNPYEVGDGSHFGGSIDLPLFRAPGGKVSYEILMVIGTGRSDPFTVTDAVAYVANLAAGASPAAALAGPPQAPFPVVRRVRTEARLLQVSPFGLRYTLTGLDGVRLRPYLAVGTDVVVVITRQVPEADESLAFRGTAPFDAPLIGGLIGQAPELAERGTPTGQGDLKLGGHGAAGIELRLSGGISLNAEYRYTALEGKNGRWQAVTGGLGFHW